MQIKIIGLKERLLEHQRLNKLGVKMIHLNEADLNYVLTGEE